MSQLNWLDLGQGKVGVSDEQGRCSHEDLDAKVLPIRMPQERKACILVRYFSDRRNRLQVEVDIYNGTQLLLVGYDIIGNAPESLMFIC